ncbi:hypothetical protein DFS34DRAFT_388276 [Phlyctochytrium arcticum]|nr:hypothetical protein DFS34DRAFT_388276 [Phlyctochytrium arcticum]
MRQRHLRRPQAPGDRRQPRQRRKLHQRLLQYLTPGPSHPGFATFYRETISLCTFCERCLINPQASFLGKRNVATFIKSYKGGFIWLAGGFYVWRNVLKALWSQSQNIHDNLLSSPAALPMARCHAHSPERAASSALLVWNFGVFMPIWGSAFPHLAIQLVKLRPVRRVMLLTMLFMAWKRCKAVIIDSLIRLFDEELPLVLDAATALASGSIAEYKLALKRLLPLFIRYRKRNHVVIVLHCLSTIVRCVLDPSPANFRSHQRRNFFPAIGHTMSRSIPCG